MKAPQGRRDQCRIKFIKTMIATMGRTTQSLMEGSSSRGVWGAVAAICAPAARGGGGARRGLQRRGASRSSRPLFGSGLSGGERGVRSSAQRSDSAAAYTCDSLIRALAADSRGGLLAACLLGMPSVYTPLATRARLKAWRLDDSSLGSIYLCYGTGRMGRGGDGDRVHRRRRRAVGGGGGTGKEGDDVGAALGASV